MTQQFPNISKEKLQLANKGIIRDQKIESKPMSYFKDAMIRFRKNKSSLVAAIIICVMILFAIFAPLFSNYTVSFRDGYYAKILPSLQIARENGWGFWDGASTKTGGQSLFDRYSATDFESAFVSDETSRWPAVVKYSSSVDANGTATYSMYIDSYQEVGYVYLNLTEEQYLALQAYQNETNIQVIYPLQKNYNAVGANYWYKFEAEYQAKAETAHAEKHEYADVGKAVALRDSDGNFVPDYMTSSDINAYNYNSIRLDFSGTAYEDGSQTETSAPVNASASSEESYPVLYDADGNRYVWYSDRVGYAVQIDGTYQRAYCDGEISVDSVWYADEAMTEQLEASHLYYVYGFKNQTGYKVRVNYYEYFRYVNGHYVNFLFGSNIHGQDIFTCLASGARLSFLLAICVCAVNFIVGAIYGAIEGYFGGVTDMVLERISDILSSVPFIVVATLFQLHLAQKLGAVASLIFAFVLTGWIGMASRVRMQVYRFKGQEYVLAARTLGASDWRIIWKHIFPNCLGTIITGSVLAIPGVIFSESMLSYLGIVNLETSSLTSIGTMLSQGSGTLRSYPHIIFFPALFIALLEISFNLFGNGLRDAFNPSLRGVEE